MLARMKVTFDIDPDLYRSVKVEAARTDRSIRDVVAEALAGWLEVREDDEDRVPRRMPSPRAADGTAGRRRPTSSSIWPLRHALSTDPAIEVRRIRTGSNSLRPRLTQPRRLPPGAAARLRGPILALGIEPRPPGAPAVSGDDVVAFAGRRPSGGLRLLDDARLVVVLRVARRNEATYRRPGP